MNQTKTEKLRHILKNEKLPAVIIDLDALDHNAEKLSRVGKPIRLATKSIRVPEVLKRVIARHPGVFNGFMTYSAAETLALSEMGFDDFLLAYPTLQPSDLSALQKVCEAGKKICMVVDSIAQVEILEKRWTSHSKLNLIVEIDGSLRLLGGLVHLGVRRSGIRTPDQALRLIKRIHDGDRFKFTGLMVYEAQVAGLTDRNPFKSKLNPIAHLVRVWSQRRVAKMRALMKTRILNEGYEFTLFNGGGTGNLNWISSEPALSELAAGSGSIVHTCSITIRIFNLNRPVISLSKSLVPVTQAMSPAKVGDM